MKIKINSYKAKSVQKNTTITLINKGKDFEVGKGREQLLVYVCV